ncbi:MAG: hypothetical protein L6R28_22890 [Planctomycetes bacterium]|nr:hypothetical protein [Planctomycetota bacterium]
MTESFSMMQMVFGICYLFLACLENIREFQGMDSLPDIATFLEKDNLRFMEEWVREAVKVRDAIVVPTQDASTKHSDGNDKESRLNPNPPNPLPPPSK